MSDLFDKLKDGAGQAISLVRQQLAEADRKRKISLLQQQIRDFHTQEGQAINSLSAQVLAMHEAGSLTQPELVSLCRNVDDIRKQLRDCEAELQQLQPPPPPPSPAQPQPVPPPLQPVLPRSGPSPIEPPPQAPCPQCGVPIVPGATFCQSCGARLAAEAAPTPARLLFCITCGAQLRDNARFCPACGRAVTRA